jgi:hypothetical protein
LFIIEGLRVHVPIILYLFFIFYFYKEKRYLGKNEKGINEENGGLSQIRASGQAVKKTKKMNLHPKCGESGAIKNQMNVVPNVPSRRVETGDWADAATWRTDMGKGSGIHFGSLPTPREVVCVPPDENRNRRGREAVGRGAEPLGD